MMYTSQDAWDDMLESARDELDCTKTAYDMAQLRLDKLTAEYRQWELEQEVSRLQAELAKCQTQEMATPSQTPPAIAAVPRAKKRGRTPLSLAIWQQRIAALQAYLAEHPNATDGEVYRTFSHIPQAALHYLLTGKTYSSDPNNYTNLPPDFTPGTLRDLARQSAVANRLAALCEPESAAREGTA